MTLARAGASALLLLAAGRVEAAAQPSSPPNSWSIEREQREVKVVAGARVVVENLFGDVRVRGGDAGRLQLWSVGQRHADDPRPWTIESASVDGVVTVRIAPPAAPPVAAEEAAEWRKRRLDLTLFVPPESPLALRTENGLIEAKGINAPVEARSVAGEQRFWVGGVLDARSERGALRAVLQTDAWSAPSRLETVTGAIAVELRPGAAARLVLETQGELTSDFSIAVERLGQLSKRAVAVLGGGGAEIRLTSQRGDLKIRELLEAPPGTP